MLKIGSAFSLFHNESLLSKVYHRGTRDSLSLQANSSRYVANEDCSCLISVEFASAIGIFISSTNAEIQLDSKPCFADVFRLNMWEVTVG